jgi:hypothetical protein
MASMPESENSPLANTPPNDPNTGSDQPPAARSPSPELLPPSTGQGSGLLWGILLFLGVVVFGSLIFIGMAGNKPAKTDKPAPAGVAARPNPAAVPPRGREFDPNAVEVVPKDEKPYEPPPLAEKLVTLGNASVRGVAVPEQRFQVEYAFAEDKTARSDTHLFLVLVYPDESRLEFNWDTLRNEEKGTFQNKVTKVDSKAQSLIFVEAGNAAGDKRRRVSNYLAVVATPEGEAPRANRPPPDSSAPRRDRPPLRSSTPAGARGRPGEGRP